MIGKRMTATAICDRWIRGKVKIEFHPWPLHQDSDLQIAQEYAALFTERTGKKNLLGSVRRNFEEIVPFLLAEIRKRTSNCEEISTHTSEDPHMKHGGSD